MWVEGPPVGRGLGVEVSRSIWMSQVRRSVAGSGYILTGGNHAVT